MAELCGHESSDANQADSPPSSYILCFVSFPFVE